MVLTDHQYEILRTAVTNGGVSLKDATEHYHDRSSAFRSLESLKNNGLLEKKPAPDSSPNQYVYVGTEAAQLLLKHSNYIELNSSR